jgi:hypothetical protein
VNVFALQFYPQASQGQDIQQVQVRVHIVA